MDRDLSRAVKTIVGILLLAGCIARAADVPLAWNPVDTPGAGYVLYAHTNALSLSNHLVRVFVGTNVTGRVEDLRPGRWQFGVTATKDGLESGMSEILNVEIPKTPDSMRVVVQWSPNLTNWQDVGYFKLRIP